MKGVKWILAAVVCGLLAMPAGAATLTFVTSLDGPSEAPPNASPATGSSRVTIDTLAKTMAILFDFEGLLAPLTIAHIHGPTAEPGTGTAGVMTQIPTFAGTPAGATAGSYSNVFDMTDAASYNPAFVTANGGSALSAFDALVAAIAGGKAYLNLHSQLFPGGEIRGFYAPIPLPGAVWLMLAGAAALGVAGRRRAA
jgi:hypothetical protein